MQWRRSPCGPSSPARPRRTTPVPVTSKPAATPVARACRKCTCRRCARPWFTRPSTIPGMPENPVFCTWQPWKSSQDSDTLYRGCRRQTKHSSASKSARRQPPPWPRAPALPRPASRQHQQAALASSTRASAQPSASLPCGCQHEQRACTRLCPAFHALIWQQQRESVRVGEGERR